MDYVKLSSSLIKLGTVHNNGFRVYHKKDWVILGNDWTINYYNKRAFLLSHPSREEVVIYEYFPNGNHQRKEKLFSMDLR